MSRIVAVCCVVACFIAVQCAVIVKQENLRIMEDASTLLDCRAYSKKVIDRMTFVNVTQAKQVIRTMGTNEEILDRARDMQVENLSLRDSVKKMQRTIDYLTRQLEILTRKIKELEDEHNDL